MTLREPTACRLEAYHAFCQQLPNLDTTAGLVRSAAAIAMHEMPSADPDTVERELDAIAGRVRRQVRSSCRKALLAHMHEELFVKANIHGNTENYYDAKNSYLPIVLQSGQGIPITLALVYVYVARRLGLRAEGINAPGHFLVQVSDGGNPYLVDPFFGGSVLSREDAYRRLERCLNMPIDRNVELLRPSTHRQWINRMLLNLIQLFDAEDRDDDKNAMQELLRLVTDDSDEPMDLGSDLK